MQRDAWYWGRAQSNPPPGCLWRLWWSMYTLTEWFRPDWIIFSWWAKRSFSKHGQLSFALILLLGGMLDIAIYMENMEARCLFYVKVGTLTRLEQSKTYLFTVNNTGIVRLTVQPDLIVLVSFMYYPRDNSWQSSSDVLSLKRFPMYSWQSCDRSCGSPRSIPVNKHTTLDWLIAHLRAGENLCNLQRDTAGVILSIMNMLTASYSILTWSWQYTPQEFPFLLVIIFRFYSTVGNHGYTTTCACSERIAI
jgi:hypothetical protein